MITGAEGAAIGRAAYATATGLRGQLNGRGSWPDAQAALIELYGILDGWCNAAETTNAIAHAALLARSGQPPRPVDPVDLPAWATAIQLRTSPDFIKDTLKDVDAQLDPMLPILQRWNRSNRRSAARRTLRSMMRIYCPEWLDQFDEAVVNRAEWIRIHREGMEATLKNPETSLEVLRATVERLDVSLLALKGVRAFLGELIREEFPLGGAPGAGI